MSYILSVTSSRKEYMQADDCERLVVNFTLSGNSDQPIYERSVAFPLELSSEEVKTALKKYVDNFNAEAQMALENKARDEAHKNADETIESLKELTL